LGKEMGITAHMLELRRTRAGIFEEDDKKYPSVTCMILKKQLKNINWEMKKN
jgi:tRNA U55 pseudouridine synthase TruB